MKMFNHLKSLLDTELLRKQEGAFPNELTLRPIILLDKN